MNYKPVKISDCGGDLKKQWYVFYSYRNPDTKQFVVFREYISNKLKLKTQRYEEAARLKKKYTELLANGYNPFYANDKSKTRLIEAIEFLIKVREARTMKKKSREHDRYTYRKFIRFLNLKNLQHKKLDEFTKHDAQAFQDWLLTDEKLENRSVNNLVLAVKTYFNELVEREYIDFNVFHRIKKLEIKQASIVALNDAQMNIVKRYLKHYNKYLWAFTGFIYYGFMRTIEITRLQGKHIDMKNELLLIDGNISKSKKQQPVRINNRLKEIIIEMGYDNVPPDWYLFSNHMKPGRKYVVATTFQTKWKAFAEIHRMKGVHMYYLKHTANGHALDAGLSVRDIQEHNRHHSLEQTQKYLERFRKMGGNKLDLLDRF